MDFPCVCGRKFKSQKGAKIHRTKMGCDSLLKIQKQRSATADKTSENLSQDAYHSAKDIQAVELKIETQPKLPRIKFPPACDSEAWSMLDHILSKTLHKKLGRKKYDQRLNESSQVIYDTCKNIYGLKEENTKTPAKKNRRQRMMQDLRNKKRNLKKQIHLASSEDEKEGLLKIWQDLKEKHNALSRAENLRKRRAKRRKEQERFFQEPFKYARSLFDQPKSGVLKTEQDTLEKYLRETYSDPNRHIPLEHNSNLFWPAVPNVKFDLKPPKREELRRIVNKSRNKSTPGPNGIPFLVYKKCPEVLKWLHTNLKLAWKNGHISNQWMIADGVYIPKEKNSKDINQFRPISLLNVEGKIFFAVLASKLTNYLLTNKYIDPSVQKGGVPGIAGCLEHGNMIWEAIQKAKTNKKDLDVIWLDLANAYGSVPHQMVQLSLQMYHIPEEISKMLENYFDGFLMRFTTKEYTTNWNRLEVGIAMGCSVSPIIFILAMQLLLKATECKADMVELGGGCQMPPVKAFMDDTTILSSKESSTRKLLSLMDELITWCRMKFKPPKSRSLSLRKGKLDQNINFEIGGQRIPTVSEKPVKSLGRWYDESLKDTNQVKETSKTLEEGLHKIDHCPLQGKYKVWCLQHVFIPMLLWPLLVYEFATSAVDKMEAKINKFTRKWLGLPPGLSDVALYCRQAKLKLPFRSIVEEFKSGKIRLQMMLDDSKDKVVKSLNPTLKTGRKWKVRDTVTRAKNNLNFKEVIGYTQTGRQGLGMTERQQWTKTTGKNRRDMVIQDVRNEEDNKRLIKGVQQSQQGQWTNWEDALQKSLTWNDIWNMAPIRLSFLIRSTYDLLPSMNNLVKWKKEIDPTCPLCREKPQTLNHVLSACKTALGNGRYTWRHNSVLDELVRIIKNYMRPESNNSTQKFVAEGGKTYFGSRREIIKRAIPGQNLLGPDDNWEISADLPGWRINYPRIISSKGFRPDIVLLSKATNKIIVVELTIPYESKMEESHTYKTSKYEDLKAELEKEGYSVTVRAVEVGARGFVSGTLYQFLGQIGIKGRNRTKSMKRLSEITENGSLWIWTKRNVPWSISK